MAERLIQREVSERQIDVRVSSAGVAAQVGRPAASGSISALAGLGCELSEHRSRPIANLATQVDLVLTMEVAHIPPVVSGQRELFLRTFTLREMLRRSRDVGPRGQRSFEEWLHALNQGRTAKGVLSSRDLDIADPFGKEACEFKACAEQLNDLCSRLAVNMWGANHLLI